MGCNNSKITQNEIDKNIKIKTTKNKKKLHFII